MTELDLLADADARARAYVAGAEARRAYPDGAALAALAGFDEALPDRGAPPAQTLELLDRLGSPATVASNGPRYFGFVKGASLPVAAAVERLVLAWDQSAASAVGAPSAAAIERVAGRWITEILDLPRGSAVGFGTSASACTIGCLTAARRTLLGRLGWDFDAQGLDGAPSLRVVISETAHITVKKALRLLGFGLDRVIVAPVDAAGRVDPARLPALDDRTILCLQAGEVNTGAFDPFAAILPVARAAGAWTHVDGAFGLWARAAPASRALTEGVELADSWTTDGHKWLNTPYDGAMSICRDAGALAAAMNSDAAYAAAEPDAQKNLTLEFSRRARGVAIWAALRSLGREGVAALVDRHRAQSRRLADGLAAAGFEVLNEVMLNQVLIRADSPAETERVRRAAEASGEIWFGPTIWQGAPAARLSVCSWRTSDDDITRAIDLLAQLLRAKAAQ
ncbi:MULTISPECIES: pyridoxal phosphate-dependent decarboxylase family protein [Sphingomonas]|uniref:pyridoxal phosphate-dependent decarboxylase family protein n=1 Tax=Sphingomonas TaxID=13687 RepID=UPI0008376573|nr:pyridoxal-dependent decarboxylase [Sphingomonas sp. CCH10-B3]